MNSQQEHNQEILTIQEAKQELAEYDVALLEARSLRRLAVQTLDRSLHMARVATEQVTNGVSQATVREDEATQDVRDAQIRLEQCDSRDRKSEE